MSGFAVRSQCKRLARRLLTLLMLNVAIFIRTILSRRLCYGPRTQTTSRAIRAAGHSPFHRSSEQFSLIPEHWIENRRATLQPHQQGDMADYRYIGKPIKRIEDLPLLQGRGRFVDDLQFPDMLQAAFVRSPHSHALVRGIDARAAQRAPGVHAVFTLADLAPLLSQERIPLQFRTAQLPADITQFVLAKDEVAFVGEAVAVVIADTRYLAEDAVALVAVDYEVLPAVS